MEKDWLFPPPNNLKINNSSVILRQDERFTKKIEREVNSNF